MFSRGVSNREEAPPPMNLIPVDQKTAWKKCLNNFPASTSAMNVCDTHINDGGGRPRLQSSRAQFPERPPDLASRPTSVMTMPRSTALHMS